MKRNAMRRKLHRAQLIGRTWLSSRAALFLIRNPRVIPTKIVVTSYYGGGYGGNAKYIAEELIRRRDDLDIIWLVSRHYDDMPPQIRQVDLGSFSAAQELMTAKIWIDNARSMRYIPKRNDQFYVQVWHGTFGYKLVEAAAEAGLSAWYIRNAKRDAAETDLMVANNSVQVAKYANAFWYDGPIIKSGVPRNAVYFHNVEENRSRVFQELGIDKDNGLCLYAPTFRAGSSVGAARFDYRRCCEVLEQRFGRPFVMAVRLHPNVASESREGICDGAIDATDYPDAQLLASVADAMISDYSSLLVEFAFKSKYGFVFAADLEEYRNERGLSIPIEDGPFHVAYSEQELFDNILNLSEAQLDEKRDAFCEQIGLIEDGHGAIVVADIIEEVIDSGSWQSAHFDKRVR